MDKKYLTVGIVAHVDAGKTTLSEAMLYLSGKIKKLGRVDHRSSFLDNNTLERERGITIFSKQAMLDLPNTTVTLLDTPGHGDFAAECERTLQVLDCAVLVISGTDGVQSHTETIWQLLRHYNVPTFIFVTKMDIQTCNKTEVMAALQRLDENCVDLSAAEEEILEHAAMCSEEAMDKYLSGELSLQDVNSLTADRKLFPCYFGSGLKTEGVEKLLNALDEFRPNTAYTDDFGARVFKIARDAQGTRLTYVKITGGQLSVRTPVSYVNENGEGVEEKVSQIRIYSGLKFDAPDCVYPGQICALVGMSGTWQGQGLGVESSNCDAVLESVLSYRVILPAGVDPMTMLPKFRQLSEEDPQLHVEWNERAKEIELQLMGKVQTEVLQEIVRERFDTEISLSQGRIMYRETIASTVEGVGHFEPLRHYAEVHLILEPLPRGSGIVFDSICSEDALDRNWQRLILTHLQEKRHLGVLTGSPITDIKITLASGKDHIKHTEGGDFRQSTYRAVRQGLMQAKSVLLEPYYTYSLTVPTEQIGRAITDIRSMGGEIGTPEDMQGMTTVRGEVPVEGMNGYLNDVLAYTHGKGRLSLRFCGYRPCRNQDKIVEQCGYDPEADLENTPDSVFCAHGAGFNVKWNEVPSYMHLESCLGEKKAASHTQHRTVSIDERELEAIMEREFGPIKRREYSAPSYSCRTSVTLPTVELKDYIIVDGYNVIFAWNELKELAADSLDLARSRLMDMLSCYCGFTKAELVLVFDAYRTPGKQGAKSDFHNIHVAYTAEGETADAYIERIAGEIGKNYRVRVITSDNLVRLGALRSGILRTSSREFEAELMDTMKKIEEIVKKSNEKAHLTKLKDGKQ